MNDYNDWKILGHHLLTVEYLTILQPNSSTPIFLTAVCHQKTCTGMYIAALFKIAPKWKQFKYPLTVEWINQLFWVHTMEYYTKHGKKSELKEHMLHDSSDMKFKNRQNESVAIEVRELLAGC